MSRFRRLRRRWPAFVIVLAILLVYAAWPGRSTFTISPETTYATEPVNARGYIDYPTALNERLSKGITPENNANALLWQALGPRPEGGLMPPEYFKWLGIEQPPEQGDYLISWEKYRKANLNTPPNDPLGLFGDSNEWLKHWYDQIDRARRWPWKQSEQPAIADWLKQNEKPLALAIEASKRPQYFNPLVSRSNDPRTTRMLNSLLPNVQMCREIANQLRTRAMCRVGDGDFDGAWQDLMACQRLGRLIAQKGTLIEHLIGMAIVAIATDGQLTFVSHSKQSSKQLLALLDDLGKLTPLPPLTDNFDLGERFMCLDSLQSIACSVASSQQFRASDFPTPNPPSNDFWDRLFTRSIDWDLAFRNANRLYDQLATASRLPDREPRKQRYSEITAEYVEKNDRARTTDLIEKSFMGAAQRGETIGNVVIGLLVPAAEKIQNAADRIEQTQRNLHIAFALAAYRAENGRYPAKLDDLTPKYLTKVPGDIFSGKPLIYKPAENSYLIYSVGINGIDEEGRWTDDDPLGDDLRVKMPLPEPKAKERPFMPGEL